jgi:hypothetical protein
VAVRRRSRRRDLLLRMAAGPLTVDVRLRRALRRARDVRVCGLPAGWGPRHGRRQGGCGGGLAGGAETRSAEAGGDGTMRRRRVGAAWLAGAGGRRRWRAAGPRTPIGGRLGLRVRLVGEPT